VAESGAYRELNELRETHIIMREELKPQSRYKNWHKRGTPRRGRSTEYVYQLNPIIGTRDLITNNQLIQSQRRTLAVMNKFLARRSSLARDVLIKGWKFTVALVTSGEFLNYVE